MNLKSMYPPWCQTNNKGNNDKRQWFQKSRACYLSDTDTYFVKSYVFTYQVCRWKM
jgi:hypothetical protein